MGILVERTGQRVYPFLIWSICIFVHFIFGYKPRFKRCESLPTEMQSLGLGFYAILICPICILVHFIFGYKSCFKRCESVQIDPNHGSWD